MVLGVHCAYCVMYSDIRSSAGKAQAIDDNALCSTEWIQPQKLSDIIHVHIFERCDRVCVCWRFRCFCFACTGVGVGFLHHCGLHIPDEISSMPREKFFQKPATGMTSLNEGMHACIAFIIECLAVFGVQKTWTVVFVNQFIGPCICGYNR